MHGLYGLKSSAGTMEVIYDLCFFQCFVICANRTRCCCCSLLMSLMSFLLLHSCCSAMVDPNCAFFLWSHNSFLINFQFMLLLKMVYDIGYHSSVSCPHMKWLCPNLGLASKYISSVQADICSFGNGSLFNHNERRAIFVEVTHGLKNHFVKSGRSKYGYCCK
jgi:hypothetical protein